jgi:hypothetical protein
VSSSVVILGQSLIAFDRPQRWLAGAPEATHAVPGVWGHLLTFLGGQHACIGYRFSLLEYAAIRIHRVNLLKGVIRTKTLLHALVAGLNFELAVPSESIVKKRGMVTRPMVKGDPAKRAQLPLLASLAEAD